MTMQVLRRDTLQQLLTHQSGFSKRAFPKGYAETTLQQLYQGLESQLACFTLLHVTYEMLLRMVMDWKIYPRFDF